MHPDPKQSEYDLNAQQDMAEWALGMLIITVWLAVITLLGVVFVWMTFVETRKMSSITREIGQAQVRAYLSVEKIEYYRDIDGTNKIDIVVRNHGQSPARKVVAKIESDLTVGTQSRASDERDTLWNIGDICAGGEAKKTVKLAGPIASDDAFLCTCKVIITYITVFPNLPIEPEFAYGELKWTDIKKTSFLRKSLDFTNGKHTEA